MAALAEPIVSEAMASFTSSRVSDVFLTLDGQVGHPLQEGDQLEVRISPNRVRIVRNPGLDYFGVLREKLKWGAR